MKTCGIIAEYNPFHIGHRHQIEELKEKHGIECIVAVMSGNFVQRGEPAIIDKFKRAQRALENGVDVVVELPYPYATQGANGFAKGAVRMLINANVDYISFGSECGNLENLKEIASTPINPDHLKVAMSKGLSFPKAYSLLTSSMEPNDILAVSYLKELKGSSIQPIIVQRTNAYNDDTFSLNPSALAIRTAVKSNTPISETTPLKEDLYNYDIPWMERYYPYLRTLLLTLDKKYLSSIFLVSEGMENHLIKQASLYATWQEFLNAATTHRYTSSRIRRVCLNIMNQLTKDEYKKLSDPDFIRVLGFNDVGRSWLHEARKKELHVCSKFASVPYLWRKLEYKTTLLYTSIMNEQQRASILNQEIRGAMYVQSTGLNSTFHEAFLEYEKTFKNSD